MPISGMGNSSFPSHDRKPVGYAGMIRNVAGFTLIEILVTLALISILMSVVLPSMNVFTRDENLELRLMGHFLELVRRDAFLHNRNNLLVIRTDRDTGDELQGLLGDMTRDMEAGFRTLLLSDNHEVTAHPRKKKTEYYPRNPAKIISVLLPGPQLLKGFIVLPFNRDGSAMDAILHVTVKDKEYSLILNGYQSDVAIRPGHLTWENYLESD